MYDSSANVWNCEVPEGLLEESWAGVVVINPLATQAAKAISAGKNLDGLMA